MNYPSKIIEGCTLKELENIEEAREYLNKKVRDNLNRTNSFIFYLLKDFQDIGLEEFNGEHRLSLSSFPYDLEIKRPFSRRVRKYLNKRIKDILNEKSIQSTSTVSK